MNSIILLMLGNGTPLSFPAQATVDDSVVVA